jgi:hypothetical protein
MADQLEIFSTLVQFIAFVFLVALGGFLLCAFLAWSDGAIHSALRLRLPSRDRRRRAIIPLTKIA